MKSKDPKLDRKTEAQLNAEWEKQRLHWEQVADYGTQKAKEYHERLALVALSEPI